MFKRTCRGILLAPVLALLLVSEVVAAMVDFESFSDSEVVTNQVSGLTISNATALTAGLSLNEMEFPPNSGSNVATDLGGEIVIDFASLMSTVSAYFTYATPLTLEAFDAALVSVGTVSSIFNSNAALSGDAASSPNEFLQITSTSGIRRLVITGSVDGSSFVLDDLGYELAQVNQVPEPGTVVLVAVILAGICLRRKSVCQNSHRHLDLP